MLTSASLYVCVFLCVSAFMHAFMHVCMCTSAHACVCTCTAASMHSRNIGTLSWLGGQPYIQVNLLH